MKRLGGIFSQEDSYSFSHTARSLHYVGRKWKILEACANVTVGAHQEIDILTVLPRGNGGQENRLEGSWPAGVEDGPTDSTALYSVSSTRCNSLSSYTTTGHHDSGLWGFNSWRWYIQPGQNESTSFPLILTQTVSVHSLYCIHWWLYADEVNTARANLDMAGRPSCREWTPWVNSSLLFCSFTQWMFAVNASPQRHPEIFNDGNKLIQRNFDILWSVIIQAWKLNVIAGGLVSVNVNVGW